ncbi:MAG TPA: beta-galactosidase, partial [Asticcacaulis sp.]|nr:beta-galactosidase [Asticcacaulis sp.]
GKPWLPVMGEFHPTRYPSQYWEDEIVKMKSAGIDVIAFYVIWSHHEAQPGQFDFSGDRDIRRFTELCAKHGMKVVIRIGPWAHAEVRYGGTPAWVVDQMPSRRNDTTYMSYVQRYWTELAKQFKGEMWKDGGPIIGVQLENEYNQTGPGAGIEHITALKKLAVSLGFDVPLYTVTGWDGTVYPKGEVTPVFGGYLDEPWGNGTTKMAPNEVYNFRFTTRVAGDAGAQTPATTKGTAVEDMDHTPFLGAEYGPGLPEMYRRRPLVAPDDVGAMWPVQLGSGVNLYGYYMFHGGRNPGLNMEENALVGGYNDVPEISYDFQAPYGQYGQMHAVLNYIRPFHMFLRSFGDRLAPMTVYAPDMQPKTRADLTTPRYSVRAANGSGFVFLNNYLRQYPLAEQKDVQFEVNLGVNVNGGKPVKFPSAPVTVKSGAYFIWPVNFDMDGVNLAWASAQPLTRIAIGKDNATYFFVAEDGIVPELAITSAGAKISGAGLSKQGGVTLIHPKPSDAVAATVTANGKTLSLVVLSKAEARRLWQGEVAGQTRLVLTDAEVSFDKGAMELRSMGDANFKVGIYPALDKTPSGDLSIGLAKTTGIFQTFVAKAQPKDLTATLTELRPAGKAPPIVNGGRAGKAVQPYPENIGRTSAAWSISVPKGALDGVADVFLDIDYQGDIGRLFAGADMIDDDYYFGAPWQIGLKRFKDRLDAPLTVTVMPLRKDAPIYIDDAVRAALPPGDQVAVVKSVKLVPQYALHLRF